MKALLNRSRELFDPALNSGRRRNLLYAFNIAALVLWGVFIGVVAMYFGRVNYDLELFFSYFRKPLIAVLNIIPVLLAAVTLFFVFNRMWAAFLGTALLGLVPAIINYYKILLREEALTISDIAFIGEAALFGGRYELHVPTVMYLAIAAVIVGTVAAALMLRLRVRLRLRPLALVGVAAGALLFNTVYTDHETFYYKTDNMAVELPTRALSEWFFADQFASRGFVYPFIFSAVFADQEPLDGYSEAEARALLESYEYDSIPEEKKVNVIAVMLEAYSDLTAFENIDFARDPNYFWHELQGEALHGNLVTNVFAGGTTNTEHAFIAGNSALYDVRKPTGSYVRYFGAEGYRTEFCHPGIDWVYNRKNVSEYLGFDSAYFLESRYDYYDNGTIIFDDDFLPDIVSLLEEAVLAGEPYFNFSLTYQNHSPYADNALYSDDVFVERGGLSEKAYNIITNYLWGINRTDTALRSFIAELREREEPVVVLLFGDHKPWLGDGSFVYDELGISFDGNAGLYARHVTPYIIWGNDAARDVLGDVFQGEGPEMSPMFLMPLLFEKMGWGGDEFIKAASELWKSVNVIHSSGVVREGGEITAEPSAEAKEAIEKFLYMEYYRRADASY